MKQVLLIILTAFCACNKIPENSVIIKDFPYTQTLQGDSTTAYDQELGIMGLNDAGNYILCSSHRTEYHYAVYSKDSLIKIGDILKQGRGPGEFIAPDYFSQYQIENEETKIWILERALNKYFKVNLTKTLQYDSLFVEKEYNLSLFKNSYRDVYYLNENLLFATEDLQECRHTYLHLPNCKKEDISPALPFPNNFNIHEISQTITTKHPTKTLIASAFFNFPQIDLINEQGIYKTIFYPEPIFPRETSISQREKEYFNNICSDTDFIYTLYNPSHNSNDNQSEILVFSWQGEAVCRYLIPFATAIFIDSKNRRLYALNAQKESYNTTIYPLPTLNNSSTCN